MLRFFFGNPLHWIASIYIGSAPALLCLSFLQYGAVHFEENWALFYPLTDLHKKDEAGRKSYKTDFKNLISF